MKIKNTIYVQATVIASFAAMMGCGATGSSGSGSTTITGSVGSSSAAALMIKNAATSCDADQVIATNADDETTTVDVDSQCGFTMTLPTGNSYSLSFSKDDVSIADLNFDTGVSGFTGSSLPIHSGAGNIHLGRMSFNGRLATPENEPMDQMDTDDDGINDRDDSDANGDDIDDDLQDRQCEIEASARHRSCSSTVITTPRVLEVKPRNDPQPRRGHDLVELDRDIKARFSCALDSSTVTAETFSVTSDADSVTCTFEVSGEHTNEVKCSHEQKMTADTLYTGTISGVKCADGQSVETFTWSWRTATTDTETPNPEDARDEENRVEHSRENSGQAGIGGHTESEDDHEDTVEANDEDHSGGAGSGGHAEDESEHEDSEGGHSGQ